MSMNMNDNASEAAQSPAPLYARPEGYIPRIAAVHDLCGYGKCSLGVAIPVLSAAGCDVCPVPTGVFSSHTAFPGWIMHDITEVLPSYLDAWAGIGVQVDAVYSGFLGAPEQVESILRLYRMFPNALRVVDPVMADHGKVYPTYTPELCAAMVDLACQADILTPNLTEAAIILGDEWHGTDISDDEACSIVHRLLEKGAKNVVLKGIQRAGESVIRNFVGCADADADACVGACAGMSASVGAEANDGADAAGAAGDGADEAGATITQTSNEFLPYLLHGTGDLYCSGLMAAIMCGRSLLDAAAFAGNLVHDAMIVSAQQPDFQNRGVSFEPLLGSICALLR